MKKVLLVLLFGLLAVNPTWASSKSTIAHLRFQDGATTDWVVSLAAKDTTGTMDTDTSLALDLGRYAYWDGDTTKLVGVLDVRWPYSNGYSNDGDSLYVAWIGSLDDSIWTAGAYYAKQAADSNSTYGYKYKMLEVRFGSGAGAMPYGYRYYKLLLANGSAGVEPGDGAASQDTNCILYDVRARLQFRRAD